MQHENLDGAVQVKGGGGRVKQEEEVREEEGEKREAWVDTGYYLVQVKQGQHVALLYVPTRQRSRQGRSFRSL